MVFCLSPLGDTLFAIPAIRALQENYSRARIVIIASPVAYEVLKANPYHLELQCCSDQWQLIKLIRAIRREHFDLAIGLTHFGSYFTRYCGADRRSDFFTLRGFPERKGSDSVVQLCLDIVGELDLKVGTIRTEFWHSDGERRKMRQFLSGMELVHNQPWVAIHCGGHYFTRKRWPLESFADLIGRIQYQLGLPVVLIGGAEDRENAAILNAAAPQAINTVGRLRISETALLLENCQLFIGNDSGPLHLAAAVGVPTVGLYGPTDPAQFYPYHSPQHRFFYKALPCSPCYRFGGGFWQALPKCSRPYCMEAITVNEVFDYVEGRFCQNLPQMIN